MKALMFKHKKTGRVAYDFPWHTSAATCPWNQQTHRRVLVPFTELEQRNSSKKAHCLVMRASSLEVMKETALRIA